MLDRVDANGRAMTSEIPQSQQEAIDRAALILAQALTDAEVLIATEREAHAQRIPPQLVETLDRFGDVLSKLVEMTERLGDRVNDLTGAVGALATAQELAATALAEAQEARDTQAKPQLPELEGSYAPGGEGVDVTIAAVPGFQGLMEVQRTLVRMPQVQSASVRRYQDDEAAIQLVLSQPMTPTAIAEGVSAGTSRQLIVDEARPEALRLRLRFLN
jgi:hypothetical protein